MGILKLSSYVPVKIEFNQDPNEPKKPEELVNELPTVLATEVTSEVAAEKPDDNVEVA
jgi:hypothetical protein